VIFWGISARKSGVGWGLEKKLEEAPEKATGPDFSSDI